MKRRGISGLIVIILLVLIAIIAFAIVYNLIISFSKEKTGEAGEIITCLQDVNLQVIRACYSENEGQLRFTVKNNNGFDYDTEFFILRVIKDGNTIEIPTNWHSTLKGLEQKEFIADIDNPQDADEFVFIPKIKQEQGYCYGQAITFRPEKSCI